MFRKYIKHHRFNSEHDCDGIFDHRKGIRIFNLDSYSFCISAPILKLQMTIFVICNRWMDKMIPEPINIPLSTSYEEMILG